MTDAERDALDREIAEALEPMPGSVPATIDGGLSPKGCWTGIVSAWTGHLDYWEPRHFSRDLNACAVMRARLLENRLAAKFMDALLEILTPSGVNYGWTSLDATAEQQALAAREVLRGRTDAK